VDAWQIPSPGCRLGIERQERLLFQSQQELDREERAEKTPENRLEPILPLLLGELRNRRLLADDES
jgi:hypothetical protein